MPFVQPEQNGLILCSQSVMTIHRGIAVTLSQFAFRAGSSVPNPEASGAIAGVLGAWAHPVPDARSREAVQRMVGVVQHSR